ncbi:MAG: acid phosphatase [Gammaproteobacteria bacterium]|nr:acid phosphatase [Gammaproteobacteria bacterium]
MHILVTNDDGVFAPGIMALAKALAEFCKVTVIAPDQNRSGVSSAISLETPLRVQETPTGWYQLNGTPADCVKLALSGFMNEEPDMVVSGINAGANLGDDVIYSGTVGGAIEGRFLGLPSIAISCIGHHGKMYYDTSAKVACDLVKKLMRSPMEPGIILNVNVPNVPMEEIKGMKVTRQGERHFSEPLMPTEDGRGRRIYWLGESGKVKDDSEGTDFHAVYNNFVSITPMQVDLTSYPRIKSMQTWIES